MKKLIYAFFLLLFVLSACSKDVPEDALVDVPEDVPNYNNEMAEIIYKANGCKPQNPELIKEYKLFVDSIHNLKYLTGSKIVEGIRSFWVS